MMYGRKKSDSSIVPEKPTNKAASAAAEPVEEREGAPFGLAQEGTRANTARTAHRAGSACHRGWTVYEKQRSLMVISSSLRSCTTSTSNSSGSRTAHKSAMRPPAWTA